jgi:hypothetical protein
VYHKPDKMHQSESTMTFKNSKGLIALLYLAIAFFPLISLASGYLAYSEHMAGENENIFMLCVGFVFFGFLSPFGFKLWKFVSLEYTLTDECIEISNGKSKEVYAWVPEMKVKDSSFLQLFWLYSVDKRAIALVDHMMPGYEEFSTFIKSKVQA